MRIDSGSIVRGIGAFVSGTVVGLMPATGAHASAALWTSKCDPCHTTTPSGTQLNAAGTTPTVLNYVITNQASMAASAAVTALTTAERDSIATYILGQLPSLNTSTAFNTNKVISVSSHITLGTVAFTSVQISTQPPNGTATVSGTNITYNPDANFVGNDTFFYRGIRSGLTGDARAITVTVNPPPVPVITSAATKSGTVGVFLSYTITATNSPTSYGATGLPGGLTRSGAVISGTPTTAGSFLSPTISATNAGGTDTNSLDFTIAKGTQTITFNVQTVGSRTFAPGGTFAISPTATVNSGLAITYLSTTPAVCTVSGTTVTMVAGGTCTLSATQPGNTNWNAAVSVNRSVTILPAAQTITFGAQTTPSRPWSAGGAFAISPTGTASSGLAVAYGSLTTGVCTVSGTTVTIVTAGTCTLAANQSGSASFSAAPQVTQPVTINAIAPGVPTGVFATAGPSQASISFTPPTSNGGSPLGNYTATCTAGGQPDASLSGAVSPIVVGGMTNGVLYSCTVRASNLAGFNSAPSSAVGVTPSAAPVAPSFTSPAATTFTVTAAGTFGVTASGVPVPTLSVSGALPSGVTFTPATGQLAGTPALGTVGTWPLVFTATGTAPAANQNFTLTVAKAPQVIAFTLPPTFGFTISPVPVSATSSVGLTVSFSSTTPSVCTVAGNQVTLLTLGDCTIFATNAGTADYLGDTAKQTVTIVQGAQSITFGAQGARTYSPGGTFALNPAPSASSGLPVSFASLTGAVCTIDAAGTVTIVAAGTCTIVVSQGGDANFLPATDAQQDIAINPAGQVITFPVQAARPYSPNGTFDIGPLASATSGLAVEYSSTTPGVCTVGGIAVTIVTTGTCTVAANQPGDGNFAPAPQVTRNIAINAVAPDAPTIGAATPGNGQASVEFTPPTNDGGSPITGYSASCTPGPVVVGGAASPIVVTGLANNTQYTCKVRAINVVGPGAQSAGVTVSPASVLGAALWANNCVACHGAVPGSTRFNAAGATSTVLSYVIANQPLMASLPSLGALSDGDRAELAGFIAGYLALISETTGPSMPKTVSVASHITLNTVSFTDVEVVTPPANGTLSAFSGREVVYTPNPGFTGTDSFSYRGRRTVPTPLLGDARTVSIEVSAAAPVLTVGRTGTGTGTVTSTTPAFGIACGADCTEAYAADTQVTLTAAADPGSTFTGWSGACTGTGDCLVTMDASKGVTANFDMPITVFSLAVVKAGNGAGSVISVTPAGGISCGADCGESYVSGTVVELSAAPSPGSTFTGWSDACVGTGACLVTVDAAKSVTATFMLEANGDADNDGIPNAVEPLEGRNPLVKDNDIFTVNRLFAMQQYRDFLGREGDAGGITFYTDLLTSGAAVRANVIESFFNSPEFSGTVSPIVRLYFATFLRIPDYAGLQFQVDAFRSGTPLSVIANNFSASPEFQATYGALNDTQYVVLLYQNVLGRTPVQAEIDFHVNRLNTGSTRGEVMVGFSESPEYQANTFNEVYVTMMYVGMLRRAPEQAGFDFWIAYMDAGNPGINLILGFLNAPEYRSRFLP